MKQCAFCPNQVIEGNPENYYEVTSWVHGPKLDGPIMRERTGRVAHKKCIDNLAHGQAPDQPELFPESFGGNGDVECTCGTKPHREDCPRAGR